MSSWIQISHVPYIVEKQLNALTTNQSTNQSIRMLLLGILRENKGIWEDPINRSDTGHLFNHHTLWILKQHQSSQWDFCLILSLASNDHLLVHLDIYGDCALEGLKERRGHKGSVVNWGRRDREKLLSLWYQHIWQHCYCVTTGPEKKGKMVLFKDCD